MGGDAASAAASVEAICRREIAMRWEKSENRLAQVWRLVAGDSFSRRRRSAQSAGVAETRDGQLRHGPLSEQGVGDDGHGTQPEGAAELEPPATAPEGEGTQAGRERDVQTEGLGADSEPRDTRTGSGQRTKPRMRRRPSVFGRVWGERAVGFPRQRGSGRFIGSGRMKEPGQGKRRASAAMRPTEGATGCSAKAPQTAESRPGRPLRKLRRRPSRRGRS